jgi:hypothetical protein
MATRNHARSYGGGYSSTAAAPTAGRRRGSSSLCFFFFGSRGQFCYPPQIFQRSFFAKSVSLYFTRRRFLEWERRQLLFARRAVFDSFGKVGGPVRAQEKVSEYCHRRIRVRRHR